MQTELTELWAILQAQADEQSWFSMILHDLGHLSEQCPAHPVLEEAAQFDIEPIARMSFQQPRLLTKLGKWAEKHYMASLALWRRFRVFQSQIEADHQMYDLTWNIAAPANPPEGQHQCAHCEKTFETFKAMCTHAFKKHGILNLVQRYAASNTCRACLRTYATREQVVHHLKYYKTGCLTKLVATVAPLEDDELEDILEECRAAKKAARNRDRSKQHKLPMCQAAGPQRPWPWQSSPNPPPQASIEAVAPDVDQWIARVILAAESHDVDVTWQELNAHDFNQELRSMLIQAFQQQQTDDEAHHVESFLTLNAACDLWHDEHGLSASSPCPVSAQDALHRLHSIRVPPAAKQHSEVPVQLRRRLKVDELWLIHSVHWQLRQLINAEHARAFSHPSVIRIPVVQAPIYVYVFSGRRREGDFQFQIEHLLHLRALQGQVLLLDLAISAKHDVGNASLISKLISWIHQGAVAGLLLAPPCETWSEARFIEPRAPGDPRPIRDADHPLGIPGCTMKEMEQLDVANLLLFVAFRLLFHAALCRVAAILEHPKEPKKMSRAAIWRLPWMKRLQQAQLLKQCLIWQAHFGSPSAKPTHLGIVHLPKYQQIMARHRCRVDWTTLQNLGGRDHSGGWKTAIAKEYPPRLNLAFADLLVSAHQERVSQASDVVDLPDEIATQFADLYAGDVNLDLQRMQPDFHPRQQSLLELDW